MRVRPLLAAPDPDRAYRELFAARPHSFWLDGGRGSRFSFLGTGSEYVTYRVVDGTVTMSGPDGPRGPGRPC